MADAVAQPADRRLDVLYVHPIGSFGGASRSLIGMYGGATRGDVRAHVICPAGDAARHFGEAGAEVMTAAGLSQFDNTRYSAYRGRRWLLLLREVYLVPATMLAFRRARRQWPGIRLVHINEVTALLPMVLAARWFGVPVVVHVRSVQRLDQARGWRNRMLARLLRRYADRIVAIDETVKESLGDLPATVVHNGMKVPPDDGAPRAYPQVFGERPLRLGMVGGLIPAKGIYEFLHVAKRCRDLGMNVEFHLAGEAPRQVTGLRNRLLARLGFIADVQGWIDAFIAEHGLQGTVKLLGFRSDIDAVYRGLDVVCFPCHADAPGRPIFEAALHGVPSIAAISKPKADTLVDGETGLCIAPKSVDSLFDAVKALYDAPERIRTMGAAARTLARSNFDSDRNARRIVEIYRELVGGARR